MMQLIMGIAMLGCSILMFMAARMLKKMSRIPPWSPTGESVPGPAEPNSPQGMDLGTSQSKAPGIGSGP